MAKPTAVTKDVHDLFSGTAFRVPDYQRSYAWDRRNWEDFWIDIKDGLESKTDHYWGTITLKSTGEHADSPEHDTSYRIAELVDGQQRTTTLYLFLLALSRCAKKPVLRENFIKSGPVYRLQLGRLNDACLKRLVDGIDVKEEELSSNKRLAGALAYFQQEIAAFGRADELSRYVQRQTFMLEFVVDDDRLAVKAFESLNDRGKPLTLLEKTKSFLMFNSVRYLDGRLDKKINETFGEVFRSYDAMKDVAARASIEYVNSSKFTEDELMRFFYHYYASSAIQAHALADGWYDVEVTTAGVFDDFVKESCAALRADPPKLEAFVGDLVDAFLLFVKALRDVLARATSQTRYFELFGMLGVNSVLYPLLGALETKGFLDDELLDLVEQLDIRFYKVGGKSAKAGLYRYAVSAIRHGATKDDVVKAICNNLEWHVPASSFQAILEADLYGNPATKFVLWRHAREEDPTQVPPASAYADLQVDHVFAQKPSVKFPAFGFDDDDAYERQCHKIGNLVLLESNLNKSASNEPPKNKAKYYQQSAMPMTKRLGFLLDNAKWKATDLEKRSASIVAFCVKSWGKAGDSA